MNASWPVSSNLGALRQDITSVNPLGGVDGFVKANAHGGGEDVGSSGALDGQDGWATGAVWGGTRGLLLGLGTGVGGGVSPVAYTSREVCRTVSQPGYLEMVFGAGDASGMSAMSEISVTANTAMAGEPSPSSLGRLNR